MNDEMKVINISLIMDAVKDQRKGIFDASEGNPKNLNGERNEDESGEEGIDRPEEDPSYEEKMQKKLEWE